MPARWGCEHRGLGDEDMMRGWRLPQLVRAALDNLGDVAAEFLGEALNAEAKFVEILARVAELRRSN